MSSSRASELPSGLVTFMLIDVAGSTEHWRADTDRMARQMAALTDTMVEVTGAHGGALPLEQGEGDSAVAVFDRPDAAVHAALELQRSPATEDLAIRVGIHTGLAEFVGATYGGTAIIRAARIRDAARAGEVLLSDATAILLAYALPDGARLGESADIDVKGFDEPQPVRRLEHPDLPTPTPLRKRRKASLPTFATSLVGRETEIERLRDLLSTTRLLTITGSGGSGKTRLAHAVAATSPDDLEPIWVDLTSVDIGGQVGAATLMAWGESDNGAGDPLDTLAARCAGRRVLVVLDNCEHLLDDVVSTVERVLSTEGPSRVLVTSREPLGTAGEITWRIPSLSTPATDSFDAGEIEAFGAVRLFAERARAADQTFTLDTETSDAVARICRRLDGIPLAIELAAARTRTMAVGDIASRLDDRFTLLTAGRGGLERQRTLLASVQWSHDLLGTDERRVLRRLSVFRAPFRLTAAEAVAADETLDPMSVLDAMTLLVDKSLLVREGDRYHLLETVRAFATDRAAERDELEELRDRHLDWAVQRCRAWGLPEQVDIGPNLDEALAEAPDLRAALEWAWQRNPEATPLLVFPLSLAWTEHGNYAEAQTIVERATRELDEGSEAWLRFMAPLALSVVAGGVVDWVEPARAALDLPDLDPSVRGRLRSGIATLDLWSGDGNGFGELSRASEECRSAGDQLGAVSGLVVLTFARAAHGHYVQARELLGYLHAHELETSVWYTIEVVEAMIAESDGDPHTAWRLLEPHVERGRSIPCTVATYLALNYGDTQLASHLSGLLSQRALDGWLATPITFSGAVDALLRGDLEQARDLFAATSPTPVDHYVNCLCRAAEIDLALDGPDAAEARLETAQEAARAASTSFEDEAYVALVVSLIDAARGERGPALERALASLSKAVETDYRLATHTTLEATAVAIAAGDDQNEAARLLGAADAFHHKTGARWNGPVLSDAVATLREKVQATEEYRQGQDLHLTDAAAQALAHHPPTGRALAGWDSLTAAETRVVDLVGQGLSNSEIADRLFVSVSTVKTHLVHVYQKLQVEGRPALAIAAATRTMRS